MPSSRPTIRKRIEWRVNTRRHRTLSPPNMSELPWSRFAMDEQTGEIYDRRTWSRRAARRRFRREYVPLGDPVITARFARYLTTQEIWEARDRTDFWNARFGVIFPPAGIDQPPPQAPDWWTPDEWDPAWTFCGHDAPDAAPVWLCEERLAAEATEEPT